MAEKKKGFFKKIIDALDGDKGKPGFQIINRTGRAKPRPQQKQVPKGKLKNIIKKDLKSAGNTIKGVGKSIKSALSGGGKAKAAVKKIAPKQKPSPKIKPVIKKKPLSPAQKKKSAAVQRAEDDRRAAGKKRAAKKASDTKAADTRDAKRGGFITAKAAKTAGEKSNAKMAANKKRRSDELVSRGRK